MNAEFFEFMGCEIMTIKKISAEEAKKLKGKTNWNDVDKITDKEIEEAAKNDPDTVLPTDEELKQFKPVKNKEGR
jgi:hypothetical protein